MRKFTMQIYMNKLKKTYVSSWLKCWSTFRQHITCIVYRRRELKLKPFSTECSMSHEKSYKRRFVNDFHSTYVATLNVKTTLNVKDSYTKGKFLH